ncbi:ParB/RepB/Spo0J family partition protein [Alphaproteobacteria bacterium]|nr:ParB/RepB/Spo0J family partition protein [Alphaproteobacteria bacterium]
MRRQKNVKTSGLGSGLSGLLGKQSDRPSLISENDNPENYRMIPIELIEPGPWQPRKDFDKSELESLAISIKNQGVIQPVIIKEKKDIKNEYYLIAGERRWRASQIAKIHQIPAIVRNDLKEEKVAELSLIENIQRSELNSLEEAEGYQLLTKKYNYTQEEISKAVGKSRSYIANVSRLLSLSELAKKYLLQKKMTVGQLRPLIGQEDCDNLLEMIYKKNLNARQVEKLIKEKQKKNLEQFEKQIDILELEKELLDVTGLKIAINFNEKKQSGNLNIKCKSLTEFNYIISKIKS